MGITATSLKLILKTSVMFDMIVYVSVPYSLEHISTQRRALESLNKTLAGVYKRNPKWACVNPLYSFYSPQPTKPDYTALIVTIETLMRSSQAHIVVRVPGWEYSDVVLTECAIAAKHGVPTVFEDPET